MTEVFVQVALAVIGFLLVTLFSILAWLLRNVIQELRVVMLDVNTIKTQIISALELRSDVKKDHDKIIVLEQKVGKNKEDINQCFAKVRSNHVG